MREYIARLNNNFLSIGKPFKNYFFHEWNNPASQHQIKEIFFKPHEYKWNDKNTSNFAFLQYGIASLRFVHIKEIKEILDSFHPNLIRIAMLIFELFYSRTMLKIGRSRIFGYICRMDNNIKYYKCYIKVYRSDTTHPTIPVVLPIGRMRTHTLMPKYSGAHTEIVDSNPYTQAHTCAHE